ncbi:MAG: pilus assembly protein N-terminal domain-containing protein [Gemmatimonadaceae bacterium]|nr:pilus assembly protein N-terminal domain-containing protein [Gemmatimonadaceae bacterium]
MAVLAVFCSPIRRGPSWPTRPSNRCRCLSAARILRTDENVTKVSIALPDIADVGVISARKS